MAFFNRFPYHDYNDYNLDWIISTVKDLTEQWAAYHSEWDNWKEGLDQDFSDLYNYVHDYFENLDLTEEVSKKVDELVADGTLDTIINNAFMSYQAQINALTQRMDTFTQIAQGSVSTAADAELVDIRNGYDGSYYATAGDAVRDQHTLSGYDQIYAYTPEADGYTQHVKLPWEMGWINNGGADIARTYAIRTPSPVYVAGPMTVYKRNALYHWKYFQYDSSDNYESESGLIANSSYQFTPVAGKKYRFAIKTTDSSDTLLPDAVLAIRYYYDSDILVKDPFNLLGHVVFSGGYKPEFIRRSSTTLIIRFPAGATMYAKAQNGRNNDLTYNFVSDTDYIIQAGQPLVWDTVSNSISVLTTNDMTTRYLVLLGWGYGKADGGALLPYYLEQVKVLATYKYPPYYDENGYMTGRIDTVRGDMETAGTDADMFVWITDTHWRRNTGNSPALIRDLIANTMLNKVFHGGDVPYAYDTAQTMYDMVKDECQAFRYAVGDYLYRIKGNHDIHTTDTTDPDNPVYTELTRDEVYGLMMAEQQDRVHYNTAYLNAMYWYKDNETQKIRYIGLNTQEVTDTINMSNYQVAWLANRLLELPSGWTAVIFAHVPLLTSQSADASVLTDAKDVIVAAGTHSTVTTSYGSTYDFTGSDLAIAGVFSGHIHDDDITKVSGVPFIVTTADSVVGSGTRTTNTILEQAFDVAVIDKTNRTVYLTRIGAGSDRSYTY